MHTHLFNLELDVVFYDTTSVYPMDFTSFNFEGEGPEGLAQKGYSKDKRPDLNQILIGVLMTKEGTPIGCEVFPGNCYDGATLKTALEVLSRRFHLKRVMRMHSYESLLEIEPW
jgi:transposase